MGTLSQTISKVTNSGQRSNYYADVLGWVSVTDTAYGATGDGSTDDTAAIQAAMTAAAGSTLYFPEGTYLITEEITGVSGVTMIGYGATIKASAPRFTAAMFNFDGYSNVDVFGITFDMNKADMAVYAVADYDTRYNVPLWFKNGSNYNVRDCTFTNLYNISIFVNVCTGDLNIENCYFYSPAQTQTQILDHITITTFNGRINVRNNNFDSATVTDADYGNCGVFISGQDGSVNIDGNKFNYYGRNNTGTHRLGAIDLYADTENVTISNNKFFNITGNCIALNGAPNTQILNNEIYVSIAPSAGVINVACEGATAFAKGSGNINISGNYIKSAAAVTFGINFVISDWGVNHNNSRITNNTFVDVRSPMTLEGCIDGLIIDSNIIKSTGATSTTTAIDINVVPTVAPTETEDTQANSTLAGISISNNIIDATAACIDVNALNYTGSNSEIIQLTNNILYCADTGYGIVTNTITPMVKDNLVKDCTYAFYLRNNSTAYVIANATFSLVTGVVLNDGITTLRELGNFQDGAYMYTGSATWDPGSIADGDGETKSVTVTGAALGDFVLVSSEIDIQDLQLTAYVQATNTVELRLDNNTGGAIDLGSTTYHVRVIQK